MPCRFYPRPGSQIRHIHWLVACPSNGWCKKTQSEIISLRSFNNIAAFYTEVHQIKYSTGARLERVDFVHVRLSAYTLAKWYVEFYLAIIR